MQGVRRMYLISEQKENIRISSKIKTIKELIILFNISQVLDRK